MPNNPAAGAEYVIEKVGSSFTRTLYIKPDATWFEFLHELMHGVSNAAYGDAMFFRDTRTSGGIEYYEQVGFNLLRRYFWRFLSSEEQDYGAKVLKQTYGGNPW